MAMTIAAYGPQAGNFAMPHAASAGNASAWRGDQELAAMAQNAVVAPVRLPAGTEIHSALVYRDALGATTGYKIGLQTLDGTTITDDDFFLTVADTSSAGSAQGIPAFPVTLDQDAFVTLKQTGAGTGAGTVTIIVNGIWVGVR